MKNQLREDMNKEPSVAPVIEVCFFDNEKDDWSWAEVVSDGVGKCVDIGYGIIPLVNVTIEDIRIKK